MMKKRFFACILACLSFSGPHFVCGSCYPADSEYAMELLFSLPSLPLNQNGDECSRQDLEQRIARLKALQESDFAKYQQDVAAFQTAQLSQTVQQSQQLLQQFPGSGKGYAQRSAVGPVASKNFLYVANEVEHHFTEADLRLDRHTKGGRCKLYKILTNEKTSSGYSVAISAEDSNYYSVFKTGSPEEEGKAIARVADLIRSLRKMAARESKKNKQ